MVGDEIKNINDAIASNWVAPVGPSITGFEKDIETYLNSDTSFVTALNSGTAAIHLALILLNVKAGDEVICQTKTFVASVNPVVYVGASPILVDSETESWNMCPELLEVAIQDRIKHGKTPKAIIAVNLYGMPYNVTKIHAIAKAYNIPVIEDSAEALGSRYNDIPCGTFGDYSVFSFNGNKIITTSGGGALISRNTANQATCLSLATQAKEPGMEYVHKQIGYNYRMSNIAASIGRAQIQHLNEFISLRRRNFNFYVNAFKNNSNISFLPEPKGYFSNRWLSCILLKNQTQKNELLQYLTAHNIEARPSWKPMHLQDVYKDAPAYLNGVSNDLYERGLCLPSGSNLSLEHLNYIVTIINRYFE